MWPTAEEAAGSRWFSPIEIGPMTLSERTWVPAMVPWRATEEGYVSDRVLSWYERFASGRPGALVVEATGIRDIPSGPLLRIGHDRYLPGLERLVETVRKASGGQTRLLIQIIDFLSIRRRPTPERYFGRYLQISERLRNRFPADLSDEEIRAELITKADEELDSYLGERELEALRLGYRERVDDLDLPDIRNLPQVLPGLFRDAARRAERAGFDGVELHYAHAYTMASYLSARNDRDDGYGGSPEARVRLPLEVLAAVRSGVGDRFAVGCRMLSEECIAGGSGLEETRYYAVELARAGMDFISLSRGGKFEDAERPKIGWSAYPYTGPSGYECMPTAISDARGPFGRSVAPAAAIRTAIREAGLAAPTVVAGGICTYEQAESILKSEQADIVASARQALADPDFFRKIRAGRGGEVRRCTYTNYCEGLDQKHKEVTCRLWDRLDLDEAGDQISSDGKRRLLAPSWREKDAY